MKQLITIFLCVAILSCTSEPNKKNELKKEVKDTQPSLMVDTESDSKPIKSTEIKPKIVQISYTKDSTANILIDLFNKIQLADSILRSTAELEFFLAFPNTFEEYYNLFGYSDGNSMPLYSEMDIVFLFYGLKSIEEEKLYNKYLDIAFNGQWEADAIRDFAINKKLKTDTKVICNLLALRTDEEIRSILHFVYDGPHPDDPGALRIYRESLDSVKKVDKRIATLMEETYKILLESTDGHGH